MRERDPNNPFDAVHIGARAMRQRLTEQSRELELERTRRQIDEIERWKVAESLTPHVEAHYRYEQ